MMARESAIAIVVTYCAMCPFVSGTEDRGEPWTCDALGASDGQSDPRELPEQRVHPLPYPAPPEWCPLREADRLVTISAIKRKAGR